MVNDYIRSIAEGEFTAKDFRTWCGTVIALAALKDAGSSEDEKEAVKNVNKMLDKVSSQLGNTRTVCKKYYVHPLLPELYKKGELEKLFKKGKPLKKENAGLSPEEKLLMRLLESQVNKKASAN